MEQFKWHEGIARFAYSGTDNVFSDIQGKYASAGDLAHIFSQNDDLIVHKWHHYIPLYETYFQKYRGKQVRFLEIGVSRGGSLKMWRNYFGENAIIYGIDIDPKCLQYDKEFAEVRIGSQDDPEFLSRVIEEMGGIDVVLDDGSHDMKHIKASLEYLFPRLEIGGTYFIEDLHTSYWSGFSGRYNSKRNFFKLTQYLIHDMHSWYHLYRTKFPLISEGLTAIHIHDSVAVLEKNNVYQPTHSEIGNARGD